MANQGAKKRKEENRKHMANLLRLIIASNGRHLYFSADACISFNFYLEALDWSNCDIHRLCDAPYKQLDSMAKPTYSDDGELMDGGYDMTTGGIPAFGAYKVVGLKGTMGGSEGEVEDEKSRKKREKMEKKASRGKIIMTRNR